MSNQPYDQNADVSKKDLAKNEAKNVASTAAEGGQQVADTAKQEAAQLASEVKAHAGDIYSQFKAEATTQASDQTQRLAATLRTVAEDLTGMAEGSSSSGVAAGLVSQASGRIDGAARWLENREPADLLDDVRRYARRNPGTFLAGAAVLGFLGARLTRGIQAGVPGDDRGYRAYPAGYQAGYQGGYQGYASGYYADERYPQRGVQGGYVEQQPGRHAAGYATPEYTGPAVPGQAVTGGVAPTSESAASDLKPGDLYR